MSNVYFYKDLSCTNFQLTFVVSCFVKFFANWSAKHTCMSSMLFIFTCSFEFPATKTMLDVVSVTNLHNLAFKKKV